MKRTRILIEKFSVRKGVAGLALAFVLFAMTATTCFAAEGTVIAQTAKIRAQTSTSSEVVGSTEKGKKIDILGAAKDSAGTVWYKVAVANGGYGYIRSDLVQTSATIEVTETASAPAGGSSSGGGSPAETTPTAIGEQKATITSSSNANIRSGASTQHSTVAGLPNGTEITLIGEATDSAGNKWYQMTCSYDGRTVEGYVRSDLITVSAEGEGGEGENPEEAGGENPEGEGEGENPEGEGGEEGESQQPEPEEHNDYEVVYAQDDVGEYEYWLYVNVGEGGRIRINELLSAATTANENVQKMQDQVDREKIIIFILAGVIVVLVIILTILIFKYRELYYEDYDDEEDEEEEEEEPEPVRRKLRKRPVEEEDEEEAPVRRKRPAPSEGRERPARTSERSPERGSRSAPRGERELHAAERKEPAKKAAPRKPQNFLIDDDEFEFEFLNMDDKDL